MSKSFHKDAFMIQNKEEFQLESSKIRESVSLF